MLLRATQCRVEKDLKYGFSVFCNTVLKDYEGSSLTTSTETKGEKPGTVLFYGGNR